MASIKSRDAVLVVRDAAQDAAQAAGYKALDTRLNAAEGGVLALEAIRQARYAKAGTITFEQATGTALKLEDGVLPAGAILIGCLADVTEAFDGSPTLSVGVSGTANALMGTGDITAGAAGVYGKIPAACVFKAAADTNLYATLTHTDATAGSADIYFLFVEP